ncbi:MAG: FadR/GntR family transcriptional regulator [Eubacteriales bacterium]|nr:FadR/GntR family transcriptional regulator [Eubacteriales bacterium]
MYQLRHAERKLLGSQTEEKLMEYIKSEPFDIGDKLPNEFELAELFNVGRSTIREAVKGLVSKGILEVRRGSGTFVCSTCYAEEDPLGISKLDDKYKLALELFDVRLMLEPEIAAKAAEYATEEDIRQLTALCDEVEELYLQNMDHATRDVDFHTCIASCSKNRVVETLVPIIHTSIITFVNITQRVLREETITTHRAITNAIAEHDSTGARCAMVMHLTYNRQAIMKQWKDQQGKYI